MAQKEFYESDPLIMQMIIDGTTNFEVVLYKNVFKFKILNHEEELEGSKAANGYDAMTKFPVMKLETLSAALLSVNGDKLPNPFEAKKFLNKLPGILVDALYVEYEAAKSTRDLKIQQAMITLKNSARSQTQEGSGDGLSTPTPSGSETSTPSKE